MAVAQEGTAGSGHFVLLNLSSTRFDAMGLVRDAVCHEVTESRNAKDDNNHTTTADVDTPTDKRLAWRSAQSFPFTPN